MTSYEYLLNVALYVVVSIAIIVVGYVVGRLARRGVGLLLYRLGADEWLKKFAVGRAIVRGGYPPSEFFGLVTSWVIYAAAVLLSLEYLSSSLGLQGVYDTCVALLQYLIGFVKAFVIVIVGFLLVDSFVGYVYRSSELEGARGLALMAPIAEYLRVILYVVVLIFALEQGGIRVTTLWILMTPVVWGLTAIMVAVVVSEIVRRAREK